VPTALERLLPHRLALQVSPIAILVADAAGTIVFANAKVEDIFGYASDELVGQSVDVLVPEAVRRVHAAHRQTYAGTPGAQPMWGERVLAGRRKDGSDVRVDVGITPLAEGDDRLYLASIVDLTERARVDESRYAAMEEELAFESLLAKLSFQCINLPDGQVADAITAALGLLGEHFGLDRCSFFRIRADGTLFDPVSWRSDGGRVTEEPLAEAAMPWTMAELLAGRTVSFARPEDLPDDRDKAAFAEYGTRSAVYVPLSAGGRVAAAVEFSTAEAPLQWPVKIIRRLEVLGGVFGQVLARIERDESLQAAAAEVQRLKDRLHAEVAYLRREDHERLGLRRIVGQSPAIAHVIEQIHQVAPTDATVLLLGETGTGKELLATQIHELSARRSRVAVRVNCGALPTTLIESELFGREKGAFTGALTRQVGRFELADHSTIFLDEIGELPHEVQVKLLRVLEERTIERLGSPRSITVDARIIAATHRDLEQRVRDGTFREDLYYRLNVFPIRVPPLRERVEDIPLLLWRFVEEFSKTLGKRIDAIDEDSLATLRQYPWPGNIRELRNTVERAMIIATGRCLTITLPHAAALAPRANAKLADVEREHIGSVLESTRWRIRGAGGAADRLGLRPTTLETRMAKLGIRRPKAG
jgi:formate hydrogenlyase transcriptional activator